MSESDMREAGPQNCVGERVIAGYRFAHPESSLEHSRWT
jgi:hypothetical protein